MNFVSWNCQNPTDQTSFQKRTSVTFWAWVRSSIEFWKLERIPFLKLSTAASSDEPAQIWSTMPSWKENLSSEASTALRNWSSLSAFFMCPVASECVRCVSLSVRENSQGEITWTSALVTMFSLAESSEAPAIRVSVDTLGTFFFRYDT